MKKLIPMIAVAASVASAFADVGPTDDFNTLDEGPFDGSYNQYWTTVGVEANVFDTKTDERGKVLQIADSPKATPLTRWFHENTDDQGDAKAEPITTSGLYFDSQVKFTISEEIDQEIDPLAKIAVFACCNNGEGETNLVARAAYFGETTVSNNYILTSSAIDWTTFDWTAWHRLTIKAIPYAEGKDGFVVYLDGNLCSYDGDAGNIGTVTGVATKYYGTTNSLLPSLITGGSTLGKLTQVGFVGTGSLDDVAFTDEAPSFAQDALMITITKTEGVKKVIVNDEVIDFVNNSYQLELDAGTETIKISAEAAEGYALSWKGSDTYSLTDEDGKGITEIEVTAFAVAFTVDGKPYAYDNLSGALADAAMVPGSTLTLCTTLNKAISIPENADIILDLAGNDIVVEEGSDAAIWIDVGTLTITNSTTKVGVVSAGALGSVATESNPTVNIYGGQYEGYIAAPATVFGGRFNGMVYQDLVECHYIAENYEATKGEDDYWTVGPKETGNFIIEIVGGGKYESIQEAVNAAASGATLKLLKSCSGAGVFLAEADNKTLTFDLDGNTYNCTGPAVGSSGTQTQAFHLEKGNTVTIKNGKVTSTANSGVKMLVQNYVDLTLENVILDGTNLDKDTNAYTLSNVNGTINLNGATEIISKGEGNFAFDVDAKGKNPPTNNFDYGPVVVKINSSDVVINGTIELGRTNDVRKLTVVKGAEETLKVVDSKNLGKELEWVDDPENTGYVMIQVKAEKPQAWEDVTDDTEIEDIPGIAEEDIDEIKEAGVAPTAIAAWAAGKGKVTIGEKINLDAFILDCENSDAAIADAKKEFKVTAEQLAEIMKTGTSTELDSAYPNAKIVVEDVTEKILGTVETTAKLFQTKLVLK